MKFFLLSLFISFSFLIHAQQDAFPKSWVGNWKGELNWYKTGQAQPQKVNMELRIHPIANSQQFSWQIIYGKETEDNRAYTLIAKDTAQHHWVIDENNGIVLDQYWVANKFCGAFTVQNNTIVNSYWMEGQNLIVEFYSIGAKPIVTTGNGTDESPKVDSYKMSSYQKAILQLVK